MIRDRGNPVAQGDYKMEFRSKRMENAYYWAAQARGFMLEQVIGLDGDWYVEVVAGTPTIVMRDFPDGAIEALEIQWMDYGFPTEDLVFGSSAAWERRELEDETRLFVTPTDDRLLSNLVNDWEDFESGGFGWERTADGGRTGEMLSQ